MDIHTLARRHADTLPRPWPRRWVQAAVAVVFREDRGALEVLLITRQTRAGRRWSGDMAFPGGLREPEDRSGLDTARRECREEVGLALGRPFGRLPEVFTVRPTGVRPMGITPFLFALPDGQEPRIASEEVADLVWLSYDALIDPRNRGRLVKRFGPVPVRFPTVDLDSRRIWGLTLQMIDRL